MIKSTYYENLIKKVLDEAIAMDIKELPKETPSLFIPGKGKCYDKCEKRVLYIGKDTNGWRDLMEDINTYKNSDAQKESVIDDIMQYASKALEANKPLNCWGGKGQSQYWDFVLEMQAKILGVEDKYSDEVTQSFAWGNSSVLQNLHLIDELSNCEQYKKLRDIANEGKDDRNKVLNAMIDMFKPDIIIILNWDEYATFLSEDAKKIADGCVGKIKWEYHELEDMCILWTYHPRGMITGGGVKSAVEGLYEVMCNYQERK